MRIDLVVQLREAAQAQRAGAPDGATTPLADQLDFAAVEIENLREAIRRLADQDATLSVQGGDVIERADPQRAATLRGMLEKRGGAR